MATPATSVLLLVILIFFKMGFIMSNAVHAPLKTVKISGIQNIHVKLNTIKERDEILVLLGSEILDSFKHQVSLNRDLYSSYYKQHFKHWDEQLCQVKKLFKPILPTLKTKNSTKPYKIGTDVLNDETLVSRLRDFEKEFGSYMADHFKIFPGFGTSFQDRNAKFREFGIDLIIENIDQGLQHWLELNSADPTKVIPAKYNTFQIQYYQVKWVEYFEDFYKNRLRKLLEQDYDKLVEFLEEGNPIYHEDGTVKSKLEDILSALITAYRNYKNVV